MILENVKKGWQWALSFAIPQTLRKSVVVAGGEAEGVCVEVPSTPYRNVTTYRPYKTAYLLVGTERNTRNPESILYRFYDPLTKKEFRLTEELTKLIFYRDPEGYGSQHEGTE